MCIHIISLKISFPGRWIWLWPNLTDLVGHRLRDWGDSSPWREILTSRVEHLSCGSFWISHHQFIQDLWLLYSILSFMNNLSLRFSELPNGTTTAATKVSCLPPRVLQKTKQMNQPRKHYEKDKCPNAILLLPNEDNDTYSSQFLKKSCKVIFTMTFLNIYFYFFIW